MILSASLRTAPRSVLIGLVVLGTVPFSIVGWVAVVPLLVIVVAVLLATTTVPLRTTV